MSLLQLDAMLAESGLEHTDLDEAVAHDLAGLAEVSAPAPSRALLALFDEVGGVTPLPRRTTRHRPAHSTLAGAAVLAVAVVGATGLSAAANTLPAPWQVEMSHFSHRFLPFQFPLPPTSQPAPAPRAQPAVQPGARLLAQPPAFQHPTELVVRRALEAAHGRPATLTHRGGTHVMVVPHAHSGHAAHPHDAGKATTKGHPDPTGGGATTQAAAAQPAQQSGQQSTAQPSKQPGKQPGKESGPQSSVQTGAPAGSSGEAALAVSAPRVAKRSGVATGQAGNATQGGAKGAGDAGGHGSAVVGDGTGAVPVVSTRLSAP